MDTFAEKNNLKPDKKLTIMDIFMTSLTKTRELAITSIRTSAAKFVAYVIFLSLFAGLVSFGVPSISKVASFGGFTNLFQNKVPTIEMSDGVLKADKQFKMNISKGTILINTDLDQFKFEDFDKEGIYVAIGSKNTKMVAITDIKDKDSYNEIYSYNNQYLFVEGFNNDLLVKMVPFFYIMLFLTYIVISFMKGLKYLLLAVVLTISSLSLLKVSKLDMSLKEAFRLSFYAQTCSVILVNINEGVGYLVSSLVASIIGVIITIVNIHKAMGPHMPDVDEFMNGED